MLVIESNHDEVMLANEPYSVVRPAADPAKHRFTGEKNYLHPELIPWG